MPSPQGNKIIPLPFTVKEPVCALGSQTKNTVVFAAGRTASVSRIHDDLARPADLSAFERDAAGCLARRPRIIAHDLHPDYASTRFAHARKPGRFSFVPVQHHHAHIAACMAENGLKDRTVIGVAFDGTGLGDDNSVWGAEFLLCNYRSYRRAGHLKEIELAGGEAAIREPWRVAALWLYKLYGAGFLNLGIEFTRRIDVRAWETVRRMYEAGFNVPGASSMGRLFDAAAALILGKARAAFEAELVIALEQKAAACGQPPGEYGCSIMRRRGMYVIDPSPMFKGIVGDLRRRVRPEEIAGSFHSGVAVMIAKVCRLLRRAGGVNAVVLSGGVFQNTILLHWAADLLYRGGFKVYTHLSLPPGDASLSLGQAAVAAARRGR